MTGKNLWRHIRPSKAVAESREAFSTPIPATIKGEEQLLVVGGGLLTFRRNRNRNRHHIARLIRLALVCVLRAHGRSGKAERADPQPDAERDRDLRASLTSLTDPTTGQTGIVARKPATRSQARAHDGQTTPAVGAPKEAKGTRPPLRRPPRPIRAWARTRSAFRRPSTSRGQL